MTLLIVYGLLAIGISFLCSLLEACLLSLPRSYVETLAEKGGRSSVMLRDMKANIERPLAAILTFNTVAHTFGAAGVGAQAAKVFGSTAVGVASAVMTLLVLIFSEIVPKTLGAVYAKPLALPAAITTRIMIVIGLPLIIPLEWINNRIVPSGKHDDRLSRAELLATIRLGQASGAMDEREYEIASNLIALKTIHLAEVLTPRTVVFSLAEDMTVNKALESHKSIRFARIPVYEANDPEHITGYVQRFALHAAKSDNEGDKPLKSFIRPILTLPEQATVAHTLEELIQKGHHIAVVVDEYGGMSGLVTLEDLLETLLGQEIVDETDPVADMQELARKKIADRRQDEATGPS